MTYSSPIPPLGWPSNPYKEEVEPIPYCPGVEVLAKQSHRSVDTILRHERLEDARAIGMSDAEFFCGEVFVEDATRFDDIPFHARVTHLQDIGLVV